MAIRMGNQWHASLEIPSRGLKKRALRNWLKGSGRMINGDLMINPFDEQRALNEAAVKSIGDPTALEAYYHGRTQGKLDNARDSLCDDCLRSQGRNKEVR